MGRRACWRLSASFSAGDFCCCVFFFFFVATYGEIGGIVSVAADEVDHFYEDGDEVVLWLNKIGPYHNPQETYTFYSLPFCKPEGEFHEQKKYAGIGEVLEGNSLVHSAMHMNFGVDVPKTQLCQQILGKDEAETFKYAISQHYWYQMYLDDLPMWGMVGEIFGTDQDVEQMEKAHELEHPVHDSFIYTHKKISIAHNGPRIIQVNLTSDDPVEIVEGASIEFTYSVTWKQTEKTFQDRFDRYLDYSFFEHQIHWFSIFNSFMMIIFLCGLVSLILMRTLRSDYAKYSKDDVDEEDADKSAFSDDSGWKQVHADVFRAPDHLTLYTACYGTGMQLIFLVFGVIIISIAGTLYADRGAIVTAVLVSYAVTSAVAGYASASYYKQYYHPRPSPKWVRAMVATALLFPVCCLAVVSFLNFIAISYATINVIPIGTFLMMIAIWLFVSLPLHIVGTMWGRKMGGNAEFPCRVNALPRPIPEGGWYTHPLAVIAMTGVLPFGSIFIELYFIFTSFWNYKFYYVYGFMLLVFAILSVVLVCVTIVATYFLLNSENHRWQWVTFFASGSTAFYVFLYSVYYFVVKTNMTGFLQTCFYFGYMCLFCLAMFLLCGTIGSFGSMVFIKRIYRNIKVD